MVLPVIDAVAAIDADGDLLVSLVNRGISGPVELSLGLNEFHGAGEAEITMITAVDRPWDQNTLDEPEKIIPQESKTGITDNALTLELPLCSVTQVRIASE